MSSVFLGNFSHWSLGNSSNLCFTCLCLFFIFVAVSFVKCHLLVQFCPFLQRSYQQLCICQQTHHSFSKNSSRSAEGLRWLLLDQATRIQSPVYPLHLMRTTIWLIMMNKTHARLSSRTSWSALPNIESIYSIGLLPWHVLLIFKIEQLPRMSCFYLLLIS